NTARRIANASSISWASATSSISNSPICRALPPCYRSPGRVLGSICQKSSRERTEIMKIFAFAGSLRKDSFNKKLIRYVADVVRANGYGVDLAEFNDFDMPLYNFDVQQSQGIPKGAQALAARITASDAMVIATPEYNYGIPGTLKNAIDWLSRMAPQPLR